MFKITLKANIKLLHNTYIKIIVLVKKFDFLKDYFFIWIRNQSWLQILFHFISMIIRKGVMTNLINRN